ncbi:baseplate J/gp47 family protein [Levilactobacillus andaensis]|uniref:baseplate J/gp47 family protein n=1 Tax=Levilactobacillus andaensis TaxID=2799570 RepID=UPI001940FD12|nr:baseplate J/gp47 family protein [Levilactobacillus andaensis]
MPLTDAGWVELTFDDALENEQQMFKRWLGPDIDLSPEGFWGKLAIKEAHQDVTEDQKLEDVYDGGSDLQANGVNLDRKGSNLGLQRNMSQSAVAYLTVTGEPGYLIAADTGFLSDDGTEFASARDVQLDSDGNGTVEVHSDDQAAYVNVDANTITDQAEPVESIYTVTNPKPATGGADLETDYDFRHRIIPNESAQEGPTRDGLKVGMLNVVGVTDAKVIENKSDTADKYGNPPQTVHIYVMGGLPQDVGQKILDIAGAGVTFVGKTVIEATDDSGNQQEVRFDQEELVDVKVSLSIQSSGAPDEDAIRQSVLDYFTNLTMGDSVILNQLYSYLYQINGVDYVESIIAGTGDTLAADNIAVNDYQLAHTTDDLIEVTVHA